MVVVFIGGWFWWSHIFESPKAVFWGMFNNSMATSAVTRQVTESGSGQNLKETITLELGKNDIAISNAVLSENNSVVSTETIGTPAVDYTRYTAIKTAVKPANGKPFNFSGIVGIWSKIYWRLDSRSAGSFVRPVLTWDRANRGLAAQ